MHFKVKAAVSGTAGIHSDVVGYPYVRDVTLCLVTICNTLVVSEHVNVVSAGSTAESAAEPRNTSLLVLQTQGLQN
jgi:hypothetical protein